MEQTPDKGYARQQSYRLVPLNYPADPSPASPYPETGSDCNGRWLLVETYTKQTLQDVYDEMLGVTGIRWLSDTGRQVVSDYRHTGAHVSLAALRRWVKYALAAYDTYTYGTYEQRELAEKQTADKHMLYEREKEKVSIPLIFA